jgi:hypothetical protein
MDSLTDYSELELLDHLFGNGVYAPPAAIYLALFTADPTEVGLLTNEPSTNGYARTAITFDAASSRQILQGAQVTFPQCSGGGWGTLTHWGIIDAASAGNMLAYGTLSSSIGTADGNVPFVAAAATVISIAPGAVSNYLAHKLLDFMFRNQAFTPPDIYAGFCSAAPVDTDTGSTITELTGGAYARILFADWTAALAGALQNNTDINFVTPTGDWVTITHSVLCDAITAGNLLIHTTATPNQAPLIDDPVKFVAGAYDVTLD